jgi:hypothetical protein
LPVALIAAVAASARKPTKELARAASTVAAAPDMIKAPLPLPVIVKAPPVSPLAATLMPDVAAALGLIVMSTSEAITIVKFVPVPSIVLLKPLYKVKVDDADSQPVKVYLTVSVMLATSSVASVPPIFTVASAHDKNAQKHDHAMHNAPRIKSFRFLII